MKPYYPNQKFKNKRSMIAIITVIVLAVALIATGVTIALVEKNVPQPEVSSIEFLSDKLGAYANFDEVNVKVVFSDNTSKIMHLSEFLPTGIDKSREGLQNITLTYGNREFDVQIEVVTTNVKIVYVTSGEGGSIEGDLNQSVPAGMSGTEVEAVPADGYSFAGWSDGVSSAVRRETDVSRDTTIRAVFRKNSYLVTFMLADGTVREQTVQYGERAVPIAASDSALRKYGYRFDGWDTDEWQNVTKNLTVRPVLTPVRAPYDIYVSALSGEPMGVKSNTDTNVETDSLNGFNESEGMDGSSNRYLYKGYYQWGIAGAVSMSSADGRVFDYWEIYANSVSGAAAYYKLYPGSDAMLSLPGAQEAAQFIAASDEKNGVEIQNLKFTLAEGTELFEIRAVYAKKVSTVSFYAYGDLLNDRTVNLEFKSSLTDEQLRAPQERTGYEFIGWFTEQNERVTANHEPFYVDAKLNAKYEAKDVKVTFKTDGSVVEKVAKYDQMLSNAEFPTIPAKEDFLANGWIIEGTNVAFSAETKLAADVVVVPNYRRATFDATFSKTGQGKIYYTEKDKYGASDEEKNGTERELTGTHLLLKSGAEYVFRFAADTDKGYSYKSYQAVIGSTTTGTGETLTVSNLKNEVRLSVLFERVNRTVSVKNGGETAVGTVSILDTTYQAQEFTVSVSNGMPLELLITAPKDMRIFGIFLNNSAENLLPNGVFDSYTYRYQTADGEVVTQDAAIEITYTMKVFEVRQTAAAGGGVTYYSFNGTSFTEVTADADGVMRFPYGTKLKAEVKAEAGKYIEKLQIWGKSVDFYQYHYDSFDSALFDNGNPYFFTDRVRKGFEEKDPRVTGVSFYLSAPNRTTDVAAQFGTLTYRVGVSCVGQGTASLSAESVQEGGAVNLIMQTDASYVIEGYTRVNRGATDTAEVVSVGENNSSLRETIVGITTDVQIEVRFQKRSYDVLFYTLTGTGISYRVAADGENHTVDSDRSASFTMFYGDSKTYRLAAREGYEIAKLTLVDGHEQIVETVTLPVNTDVYDLVVNNIGASRGVKVELRKKTFEIKLTANALTSDVGTIALTCGGTSFAYDAASNTAFSFDYVSDVTISAKAGGDFFIKSFTVDGEALSLGENAASAETTLTVNGGKKIEIIFAYGGTASGIVVDKSICQDTKTAHGYVAFDQPTDSAAVVTFRAFPDDGYVLKALYSNGVLLKNDGYGEYPSAYDPQGIQYITAVFEKKEMTLTLLAENGKLSSEKDYVLYGETADVWFVADTGYELSSVRKNQQYLSDAEIAGVKQAGKLTLSAEDTKDSLGAVTVTAVFTPIAYRLYGKFDVNATGKGTVELEDGTTATESKDFDVRYGDRMSFRFVADEGSYIAGITLNGVTVELSQMTDAVQKTSNGKYAFGKFDVVVTGDTELNVRFDRDVFKVTVAESAGGTAALSPVSVMGNDEYSSDESITVSLNAVSGYHIAALYINGVAQNLNLQSAEEPNLNTSVLYLIPKELLVRNLVVRAEFERNAYSVRVTAENESQNFKAADNTVDRFMERISVEYGGVDLKGREEANRANSRYTVTYQGIEHAGVPRATLKPRVSSGYYLKSVSLSYRTSDGRTETANYTAQFNEENDYSMALPSLYWDITDFNVVVARKTVTVRIPSTYRNDAKKTAIRIQPSFYVGSQTAIPSKESADDVYVYEFGVRLDLEISVTEGFTPTKFTIQTSNGTRNFLGDVVFRNGKGTYSATLSDDTEFSFEASVTMVTLSLTKVGAGSGTFNFVVDGSAKPDRIVTVEYGTPVGIVVVAEKANGSYLRSVRIDGVWQNLGQADEDGHYYEASLTGSAARDAEYEVDLAILEYTFKTEMPEGVQGVAYNNDNVNVFPWGTARVGVRIELRQGYELRGLTVNGRELTAEDYVADGSLVTFYVLNVSSDQKIVPTVGKKTFTASNNDSSLADNKTEILRLRDDGTYEVVANNVKNNIAYGDRLFFVFRPAKNWYADSYDVSMKTLGGVWEQRNGEITYPEENNSDIFRVEAGLVTGDVTAEILYKQKVYTLEYRDDAGGLGVGEVAVGQSQIVGGEGVKVSIQTKNLRSADGNSVVYYGVRNVKVNGYDYFVQEVPFEGWGELSKSDYDSEKKTYSFDYRFVASDALMLGTDKKIGSGTDFTLKLEIVIEKNLYYLEEVVLKNKENGENSEPVVLEVSNGTFGTAEFTGKFSDSIFDGSSDLLELDMTAAYSPVFVGVRTDSTDRETEIQSFAENAGTQKIFITASAAIADMSNPYKKTIRLVVVIDRNRYDTEFSVLTNEKDGKQDSIGKNLREVKAKIDDKEATDEALKKISHGSVVTITAGEQIDYDFAGFETYDEQTGKWVKAENVVADGVTVVSVEGRELTVAVVREFRYRAVYYKKVTVDIVLAPWHKYLSGTYVSGNGSELSYVNYASLIVTVGGEEKRYEVEQSKNDNGIFRYVFRYGDLALLEARDEKSGTNASKKITFYLQNRGAEQAMQSVDAVLAGQMRFRATEDYVYDDTVTENEALYVAFDNQIKLNVATETLGGADSKDGASFQYEKKASGANTSYNVINLTNGRTANVSMFDRIRVTVTVPSGYRFESFSRYQAQRDSLNLTFLNSLETFARFKALGYDDWELVTAGGQGGDALVSDSRFTVEKKQDGTIVVEFTVTDNSIYKFDFVKVYELSGSVSAPRFVGDGANNTPTQLEAENNKSYFVSDASGVKGKIDYGATVTLKLAVNGENELFDTKKWQFISWYANGAAVKSSGLRNFNYYDDYADERIVLNEQYGFVGNAKTDVKFEFRAEFLPIYEIQSLERYRIGDVEFRPSSSFEMTGLYYDDASAQVQIPQNPYSEAVNRGDGSVVTKKYLPFDARKGADGGKADFAKYANELSFNVVNAVSYSIVSWNVYYGDYNADNPTGGSTFAGNTQNVTFTMTKEIYEALTADNGSAYRPVTIVPVFSKKNDINVRKSVFYFTYGVATPEGRSDNNPGIVGAGDYIDTEALSSGIISVNYGETVTLDANPKTSYRFIGWFDPSQPQDSTEPAYGTEKRITLNANKTSNEDYTFYYEARYVRTVTLELSSLNTSGSNMTGFAADVLKGDGTEEGWIYQGVDISKQGASQTKTFDQDNNGNKASLVADVGSYALFRLAGAANDRGFDPAYDIFMSCVAASGSADYTATKQQDGSWKVVVFLDRSKTIAAQYQTFGTVTIEGLLDQSTVTLGAEMSKNIYEYAAFLNERAGRSDGVNSDDLMSCAFNSREVVSASFDSATKRVSVTLHQNNLEGKISIRGVKKADYQNDVLTFKFRGLDSLDDDWGNRLGLNFHGNSTAAKTATAKLTTMPFASGAGTETNPYLVSGYEQFLNIGKIFTQNGGSLSGVYLKQTADITLSGDWNPMCAGENGFNGDLNGDNKTIFVPSTLQSVSNTATGGIFAKTGIGTVRNYAFRMGGAEVRMTQQQSDAGIVAGIANGTTFENLGFEGFKVVAYGKTFGLVAGSAADSAATNVSVKNLDLEYQKENKGSVFGSATDTVLDKITFTREATSDSSFRFVTAGSNVGGIVGLLAGSKSELKDSYLYGGNIRATGAVGGAIGMMADGAKITNVAAILKTVSGTAPQMLQVSAENTITTGSTSLNPNPSTESTAADYAAGGLVGVMSKSVAEGLYVASEVTALMKVTSPYTVYRNYPTVSVVGSVAGGLVGLNGNGSTVKESYIEEGATAEILMPSRSDVNSASSTRNAGSDGVFGGIVASNFGTVYHCGVNGKTYNGETGFGLDQVSGNTTTEKFSADNDYTIGSGATNPFDSQSGSSKGLQLNASVEFLYAACTAVNGKLQKSLRNNFYYGANYTRAHGSTNDYQGDQFAARGTSTTVMGGIAGYNARTGFVNSSYVAGKVVHFRRLITDSNGTLYSILGGVVGYNMSYVYNSGVLNTAVYNFVKPVTDNTKVTTTVTTGGVIGHSQANYLRGLFSFQTAVRSINDPWAEAAKHGGGGSGSTFSTYAAALVSNAATNGTQDGMFCYGSGNKVSATSDAVVKDKYFTGTFTRIPSLGGINVSYGKDNDFGGNDKGVYVSGSFDAMLNKQVTEGSTTWTGTNYFKSGFEVLLLTETTLESSGNALKYLGKNNKTAITLANV